MFRFLSVVDFRNFSNCRMEFSPGVNVFLGDNGQGKSNLLEALSLCSQGASFRIFENKFLIRHDCKSAIIDSAKVENGLEYNLKTVLDANLRIHFLNEKKTNSAFLRRKFLNIVFSPESLEVIKDSAEKRRALFDDLIVSFLPANAEHLVDYRKCLRTRNRILKDFVEQKQNLSQTEALLEAINPKFLQISTQITAQRLQAIKAIQFDFNNAMQNISRKTDVEISVEYVVSETNIANFEPLEIHLLLKRRLLELQDAELASGVSLIGPHRHDIRFLYGGNDSRFFCSQGQQRALILSFKMAQIVYHRKVHGTYPVLMLDDVLSELDAEKRDSLIAFLSGLNTQIFITTTDLKLPQSIGSDNCFVLKVREGKIL